MQDEVFLVCWDGDRVILGGRIIREATVRTSMDGEAGQEWVAPSYGHQTSGVEVGAVLDLSYVTISYGA